MADQDPEPPRLVRPYVAGPPDEPMEPAEQAEPMASAEPPEAADLTEAAGPASHRRRGGIRPGRAARGTDASAGTRPAAAAGTTGGQRRAVVAVVAVVVVALVGGLITAVLTGGGRDGTDPTAAGLSPLPLPTGFSTLPLPREIGESSGPPEAGHSGVSSPAAVSSLLGSSQEATPQASAVAPGGGTPAAAVNTDGANLALGRPVAASSQESHAFASHFAVDGDTTWSRWSSAFSDPQWISVDLGQPWLISQVVLRWEAAHGVEYDIAVSTDGTTWRTVWRTAVGAGGVQEVRMAATPARFVRMTGTRRNGQYGYSLFELEVR